jgi:hypothetical protein
MTGPHLDRTELEEMVQSSPYGTAFVSPNVRAEETLWSFLIHESQDVVDTVEQIVVPDEPETGHPETKCVMITLSSDGVSIPILVFLFRFETDPPAVYSIFMNPTDPHVRELLDDLSKQKELIVDFHDEHHVARLKRDNDLRECIIDTLASLGEEGPVTEEVFDLALDNLVSDSFDSEALWELFGRLQIPG